MSENSSIRLAIFDWAGTTVDFGSLAPTAAFTQLFAARGLQVDDVQVRGPMGMNKREHLLTMFRDPAIAAQWHKLYQRDWNEADIDEMYHAFAPLQLQAIEQTSALVPNLLSTIAALRAEGIKIGGSTGYFTAAAQAVASQAAKSGFAPDINICADDVPQGRPAPWMIYRVMERLGVFPVSSVVNIGDTVADIEAGIAAGCWSVGVCDSSSLTGLSAAAFAALSPGEQSERICRTAATFRAAGCHAVVNTISELPGLIAKMNGKQPSVID